MPLEVLMVRHICPDGSDPQIQWASKEKRWRLFLHGLQLLVRFCYYCGEKLEEQPEEQPDA